MPILKDGERWAPPKQEIDALKNRFLKNGTTVIRVRIPEELITHPKDNPKKNLHPKIQIPFSSFVQLYSTKKDRGYGAEIAEKEPQMSEISYYKTLHQHPQMKDQKLTMPRSFELNVLNKTVLVADNPAKEDWDLVWYLFFASQFCKNGENFNPNCQTYFEIEDRQTGASQKYKDNEQRQAMAGLLYGDRRLPITQLTNIAKGLNIANVNDYSYELLVEEIERITDISVKDDRLKRTYSTNRSLFLAMAQDPARRTRRAIYYEAIERKVIGVRDGAWHYISMDGKKGTRIMPIRSPQDANDELWKFFETQQEEWDKFLQASAAIVELVKAREGEKVEAVAE